MAGGFDTRCLYSTVRNRSGKAMTFGFLPPHGRKLAHGEEFTVFGDIKQAIIRFERTEGRRNIIAFENALQRQDIEILETPNVILRDENNPDSFKMLIMRGGTLGIADPCWQSSLSETPLLG